MGVHKQILLLYLLVVASESLGSSDDRFIKKYAMMKIYESCFGPEVVKQIRQEMKEACAKCAAAPSLDLPLNPNPSPPLLGKLPPGFGMDPNLQSNKPNDNIGPLESQENDLPSGGPPEQPQMNVGKLTQTIMAFRPHAQSFQPQPQSSIPPYMVQSAGQFRPFSGAAPFYQFPYNNLAGPSLYYPGSLGYNPYSAGQYQAPYQQPQSFYQQPYFGAGAAHRMSRDMDLRDRFEMLTQHGASGDGGGSVRSRNITCVMQELGYLDYKMEPNYEKITTRIANLPVSSELKGDIQDGLQFCQKFAQCVPDVKKDVSPLSKELIKPMFFFRCYKHKKLEACIMKDIRERFTSADELDTDTDFRSLARSGKSLKDGFPPSDPQMDALDEMSVYLYDFLSGSNSFDFDLYM